MKFSFPELIKEILFGNKIEIFFTQWYSDRYDEQQKIAVCWDMGAKAIQLIDAVISISSDFARYYFGIHAMTWPFLYDKLHKVDKKNCMLKIL